MCVDLGAGKRVGGGWLQGSAGILARRGSYFHAALLALHAAGARLLVRSPGSGALGLRFIGHGDDRLERAARETFTRSPGEARKGAMACIAMWGARVASPHPNIRRKRQGSGSTISPTRPSCPCPLLPIRRTRVRFRGCRSRLSGRAEARKQRRGDGAFISRCSRPVVQSVSRTPCLFIGERARQDANFWVPATPYKLPYLIYTGMIRNSIFAHEHTKNPEA